MKKDCLYVFIITFGAYLVTLSPTIYWRDSAELVTTAFELGIAHPSGSPLYSSLANLFTYLPFGGVAFRVNLFSSFFCSLAVVLTFITTLYLLRLFPVTIQSRLTSRFIAFYAALSFGFSRSFWDLSTTAEVYSFQVFFIILILCLLALLYKHAGDLRESGSLPESLVYLIGLFFGLSSGAHIIMLLYFPAIIISIALFWKGFFKEPRMLGLFLFFVILGGSVYIYLPVRSSANPFWDWGNPETFANFWTHVTDKKDAGYHFGFSFSTFLTVLKKQFGFYWNDFSLIGICLGITGISYTIFKRWRIFVLLAGMVFAQWIFFIRYWEWSSQYVPSFMVFSIFIGIGLKFLLDWLYTLMKRLQSVERFGWAASILLVAGVAQVASATYLNGAEVDKAAYWSPREFYTYLLEDIDDGGVVIAQNSFFGLSYLSFVEGAKPTLTLIGLPDMFDDAFNNRLSAERSPLLVMPDLTGVKGVSINRELQLHNPGRAFYWEPSLMDKYVKDKLLPGGYFYRLRRAPGKITSEDILLHKRKVLLTVNRSYSGKDSFFKDKEESELISINLLYMADYFIEKGDYPAALSHLNVAATLLPDYYALLERMGVAYAKLGDYSGAQEMFIRTVRLNPVSVSGWRNLGLTYLKKGELGRAEAAYEKALEILPGDSGALNGLASLKKISGRAWGSAPNPPGTSPGKG